MTKSLLSPQQTLIAATGISKSYDAALSPGAIFLEALTGIRGKRERIEALKPMNVSVERGASVGILGRNGAGKSTLLGLLAGHVAPTTGKIERHGRIAALVGIGQQFNVNETGRYNAAQFCSIQGASRAKAKEMIAKIAEFSELGSYFDRPVKTYSSGMRARLSFSCATFVDADLIIIDEVLAVGDAEFRSKCYGHIEASIDAGQTYIMVSHSPAVIGNYCSRALVLHEGNLAFDGDPLGGMQAYDELVAARPRKRRTETELLAMRKHAAELGIAAPGVEVVSIKWNVPDALIPNADLAIEAGVPAETSSHRMLIIAGESPVTLQLRLRCHEPITRPRIAAAWRNSKGIVVAAGTQVLQDGPWNAGEDYDVSFTFTPRLVVGGYQLRFTVAEYEHATKELVLEKEGLAELHVLDGYRAGLVDLGVALTAQLAPEIERA